VEPAPIEHRRAAGTLPGGAAGAGEQGAGGSPHQPAAEPLGLSGLLSLTLLELTLEYERRSSLSLALSENVLRVAGRDPLPVTEVRRRAGISREAVAVAVAYLQRHGLGVVESTPGNGRAKALRLTSKGEHAAAGHAATMAAAEASLAERCGGDALAALQTTLARFATSTEGGRSRLAGGLAPYPEGWRATRPYASQTAAMLADPTGALPHHPLVTHRGGWPDGS
jgi:DNA-binding MarR family transcriptional regulator